MDSYKNPNSDTPSNVERGSPCPFGPALRPALQSCLALSALGTK